MALVFLTAATASGAISLSGGYALLASAAAMAVDSMLIYPSLFKPDPVEGQRFNGLEVSHVEEGAPANRLFGKTVRVAGTTIWQTPLREVEEVETSSKGGTGGEFIRFKYFRDIAVEICRVKRGKTIKGVRRVYADGKLFYNQAGLQTFSSLKLSAQRVVRVGHLRRNKLLRIISDEAAGGPSLNGYQSGRNVTVSGFSTAHPMNGSLAIESTGATATENGNGDTIIRVSATAAGILACGDKLTITGASGVYTVADVDGVTNLFGVLTPIEGYRFAGSLGTPDVKNVTVTPALSGIGGSGTLPDAAAISPISGADANNGTWRCLSVERISPTQSAILLRHPTDETYGYVSKDDDFETINISQEDASFSKAQAADVRFYNGSRTQQPDPTIKAAEEPRVGVGNVLAYRGRAYMVVEDLEVTDFGNRTPSFEFELDVEEDDTLATALSEMCLDVGVPLAEQDFSLIPSTTKLGGYVQRGVQNAKSALQPLMLCFHLVSQQDERIRLLPRTATTLIDVTGKTVAFAPGSARSPRPGLYRTTGNNKAVQIAVVRYFDPVNNYTIAKKQFTGTIPVSAQTAPFDTNLVMTGDEAQRLVNTLFELGRLGRRSVSIDLPPSFLGQIAESVRVRLNKHGQDRQFLLGRLDEGANWVLKGDGPEEDLEAFNQTATSEGTLAL